MIPKPKHLEIYTAIFAGITFHSCPQNINMGGGGTVQEIHSPKYSY